MTRRVILYPGEDGYLIAEVPSLPGCISQGKTRDEALANIQEAIALHIEGLQERDEPVPELCRYRPSHSRNASAETFAVPLKQATRPGKLQTRAIRDIHLNSH